jgi:AraC family transcriptional regulator
MKPETMSSHQERVLRLLVMIDSDLSADLSLETLARKGGFSPYHFHRIFHAIVGEPVKEYVRRLRLERASHELLFGARPIIEVALDAGYQTHESFTRAFRAARGSSPSEYRRRGKRATPSPSINVDAAPPYRPSGRRLRAAQAEPRRGRVERLPSLRVAFIRHVGRYEAVIPVFTRLADWVRARQGKLTDVMWIGVPHDNPHLTPPEKLRFDCCVMVSRDDIAPSGEIGLQEIGGGTYATTTHYGAFDRLPDTYGWLGGHFLPSAGLILRRAPAIEIYLTNPETTAPAQLLTDILLPVERPRRRPDASLPADVLHKE